MHGSTSQQADMAELILFYTLALLNEREPYPPVSHSISTYFVTVPSFPRIFKAREGLFCQGRLVHRGNLSPLCTESKGFTWPISLRFVGHAGHGHDEVVVSFGRLLLWLFQTQAVAKAVVKGEASERLRHEFGIYQILLSLQGTAIPVAYGLYYNTSDRTFVLILSYAGNALTDFENLTLKDRWVSYLNFCLVMLIFSTERLSCLI